MAKGSVIRSRVEYYEIALDCITRFHNSPECEGPHAPLIADCECGIARAWRWLHIQKIDEERKLRG